MTSMGRFDPSMDCKMWWGGVALPHVKVALIYTCSWMTVCTVVHWVAKWWELAAGVPGGVCVLKFVLDLLTFFKNWDTTKNRQKLPIPSEHSVRKKRNWLSWLPFLGRSSSKRRRMGGFPFMAAGRILWGFPPTFLWFSPSPPPPQARSHRSPIHFLCLSPLLLLPHPKLKQKQHAQSYKTPSHSFAFRLLFLLPHPQLQLLLSLTVICITPLHHDVRSRGSFSAFLTW